MGDVTGLDRLCVEIASRPGAAGRIEVKVERMNRVLDARQSDATGEPVEPGLGSSQDA
jgi:hypothetical protein